MVFPRIGGGRSLLFGHLEVLAGEIDQIETNRDLSDEVVSLFTYLSTSN